MSRTSRTSSSRNASASAAARPESHHSKKKVPANQTFPQEPSAYYVGVMLGAMLDLPSSPLVLASNVKRAKRSTRKS